MLGAPSGDVGRKHVHSARYNGRAMPGYDDEDDWVGEPPEGRISRDRARPEYWRQPWPIAAAGTALLLVIVVVILILH